MALEAKDISGWRFADGIGERVRVWKQLLVDQALIQRL
jgi:hypothetical protein